MLAAEIIWADEDHQSSCVQNSCRVIGAQGAFRGDAQTFGGGVLTGSCVPRTNRSSRVRVFRFEGVEDDVLLRENVMNLHPGSDKKPARSRDREW